MHDNKLTDCETSVNPDQTFCFGSCWLMPCAYCAKAAAHVWLGRKKTCAVSNCQRQQRQHGANADCADGSNMILYLAFILDDTVGE